MTKKEKILDIALLIGAAAAILCASFARFSKECEQLRDSAFRLHIMANSDSAADQRIKYALRDYILDDLGYMFRRCGSKENAVSAAKQSLPLIEERVDEFLRENGCPYTAECTVEKCGFSTRRYGDVTLPAGEYDALKIVLGSGEGRNWWCVLFPSVCLPAAEAPALPVQRTFYEEQKKKAQRTADSRAVESGGVEFRFALYEFISGLTNG